MAEQTPIRVAVVTVIGRQSVRLPTVVAGIAVLANRVASALMNQESFIRLFGKATIVARHSCFLDFQF